MTSRDETSKGSAREQTLEREVQELRGQLQGAYEHLTDVTSRLLLANEAADAALSTHDRVELSEQLLHVCAAGVEVSRAAVFLVEGEGFSVGATQGLDEDEVAALPESQSDVDACGAALERQRILVLDRDLVVAEVLTQADEDQALDEDPLAEEGLDEEAVDGEEELVSEEEADADHLSDDEASEEGGADDDQPEEAETGDDGLVVALVEGKFAEAYFSLYLPVLVEGQPVAVLGLSERIGGRPYQNDQIVFLRHLMRQFAVAIHRGFLVEQNEERLRELNALLRVSREITSTLDIDAVMRGVVNTVSSLVENDRAEIVLLRAGRLKLSAVSGRTRLDHDQVELLGMERVLEYLRLNPRRLQITARELEVGEEPVGADVFTEYFANQEMSSFMALPLKDEQGLLGFLCLESLQPAWEVEPAEGDALDIVAAQTSVAIRNAQLYSEIPFRQVGQPVLRARARWQGMSRRNRALAVAATLAVLVLSLFPIFPERAGGAAEVQPLRFLGARALTEGVVTRVLVRGGEEVVTGQPLAVLEDLDLAERVARLKGDLEVSRRGVAEARRAGHVTSWRAGQIEIAALERTLAVEEHRERSTQLAAPFAGRVLELNLQQRLGLHLDVGESFCTVASLDSMSVEIEVSEHKIGKVLIGQPVGLKVHAFPGRAFTGHVTEVGWRGIPDEKGVSSFRVRAAVENRDGALRPGMTGIAKASLGWRAPAGAFFEPIARWMQLGLW